MSAQRWAGPMFEAQQLARPSHPAESKQAAREAVADGAIEKAQALALEAVRATPGLTCVELEKTHGVLGRLFGRRLNELEIKRLVRRERNRRCRITGRTASTWWPL